LLAKSRSSIAALAVSLVTLAAVRCSWKRRILGTAAVGCAVAAVLLLALLFQFGVGQNPEDLVLMGRSEDSHTLAGRLPLWELLLEYIGKRPWLGYGWGAFWTADRIGDISADQNWSIGSAHSSYLEMALQTGWVGFALLLAAVGGAFYRATVLVRGSATPAAVFFLLLFVYAAIHGLTEAVFVEPSFGAFLVACGVMQIALRSDSLRIAEEPRAPENEADCFGFA
jgi:O-antigen ligase